MAAAVDPQLSEVLDDSDDDEEKKDKDDASSQKRWLGKWEDLCAYRTYKIVRIKDRNLGYVYWGVVTLIIIYIIIFALCIEGKHQYQEPGIGTVITKFKGKAFFNGKVYDEADLRFPEVEPFGAFIMTKSITMKGQTLGNCTDYDNPCPCRAEGQCVDEKFCKDAAWCPSLGEGNVENPPQGAVIETMQGLEHSVLQLMSGIAFPGIGNYFFVTGKSPGANNPYRNITLKELLSQAQPPGSLKLEDVLQTGALISVSFFWNCDVDVDCEPAVIVKRQDNGKGFVQKRVTHQTIGGKNTRDAIYMYGLRILVESSGIGRHVSVVLIVIQIGSGLALLRTASMAADFLMLRLYSKVRSDAYYKCKVQDTEDYSDLQDRLNLVQKKKEDEKMAAALAVATGEAVNAKRISVGLGPGSRGGLASHILK